MNTPEKLRYFYHPDHIGSTSWVTDSARNGIQYCEYLPYGEPFLEKRSTTWNSRYTFSGKERDGETGYSYFGARYYNSDISIWLSVDPMSDKYPNLTPYAYCANNPIILVDPDGKDIDPDAPGYKEAKKAATETDPSYEPEFAKIFNNLEQNHDIMVRFDNTAQGDSYPEYTGTNDEKQKIYTVFWNSSRTSGLGTSAMFEETFHLQEALEGVNIAFDDSPKQGMSYVDIYDEVRAKLWVINNIKSINKYTDLGDNYYGYSHYGYIKKYIYDTNAIIKFLQEGVTLEAMSNTFSTHKYTIAPKYSPCCSGGDYKNMSIKKNENTK